MKTNAAKDNIRIEKEGCAPIVIEMHEPMSEWPSET